MFKKIILLLLIPSVSFYFKKKEDDRFVSFIVNPKKQPFVFYYQNDKQENYKSILNLKLALEQKQKKLLFATNGGMYKKDHSPQGLFIQNYKTITPIDTNSGGGNFYLLPNGVFYITDKNIAHICKTEDFKKNKIRHTIWPNACY
jgi:uncharacterized protein YigE (DUF2233 family)